MFRFQNSNIVACYKVKMVNHLPGLFPIMIPRSLHYKCSLQLISDTNMHFVKPNGQVRVSVNLLRTKDRCLSPSDFSEYQVCKYLYRQQSRFNNDIYLQH